MLTLAVICLIAVVTLFVYEYRRAATNPDYNCLNDLFCPLRFDKAKWKNLGKDVHVEREKREEDTLTKDGRLEHISFPVPDPVITYRDLFA